METWAIIAQIAAVLFAAYYYLNKRYEYWSKRGIKGPPPTFGFGNLYEFFRYGQSKVELEWAAKYGKTYGNYQGFRPFYTVLDPELAKTVLVKDFTVFVNRDINPSDHEILSKNLFNAEDEQWRRVRAITSPSFTTGKLKGMHSMMNRCIDKLGEYFQTVIKTNDGKMNMKEVIMGFTIDVIASTSFAVESNANDAKSRDTNPFLINGIKLFDFSFWRFALLNALPKKVNKWINNETGNDPKVLNFFIDLGREIIKQRRGQRGAKRNDLVQLMMDSFVYEDELKGAVNYEKLTATADNDENTETTPSKATNGSSIKRTLTETEIIAQILIFFLAGFETTASTISNSLYYLAVNPQVQERLVEELEQALAGIDEDSTEYFDIVNNKIPYLEACIKETLRLVPPVPRLQRRVGIDGYKLNGVPLEKDVTVEVGVYAIHHSAEFYPEPERYNPDRFMPENKHNIVPYSYLPFGQGPRNCIGMRFAYQEIRLCLAKILRQYKFSTTPETKIPLELVKIGLFSSKNIQLKVSQRK